MTALITAEYQGAAFSFRDDGWFNATAAAKRYGKLPNEWLRLPETKAYIAALDEISNAGKSRIWQTTKRGNDGGTWMHPKLAVRFAQWLDIKFAIWCDMQIDAILRGQVKLPRKKGAPRARSLNSAMDRLPLHHLSVDLMVERKMSQPAIFQMFGRYAGVRRIRLIPPECIGEVISFAHRFRLRQASAEDQARIEAGRRLLANESPQLELLGAPLKGKSDE